MKRVVFLCPYNTVRSQIAAALFNRAAGGRAVGGPGGTNPKEHADERTLQVLREVGIEPPERKRARVTREELERADRVIGLDCPLDPELSEAVEGKFENWPMPDTTDKPVEAVREVRDLIGARVQRLLGELEAASGGGNERR
jgi:arsenate reductase (thioredoxin)